MSKEKTSFEVIDDKFWILPVGDKGLLVFQTFKEAVSDIFSFGLEEFVIEGRILFEFLVEDLKFMVGPVKLIDIVKEWYRITGRERAEEKVYTQRPEGYQEEERESETLEERRVAPT